MSIEAKDPILARIEKLEQQSRARIEKLERENRRLKQGGLLCAAVVALVALTGGLMGQTQTQTSTQTTHSKSTTTSKGKSTTKKAPAAAPAPPAEPTVPEKIESESFVLDDAAGHKRAELSMGVTGPSLSLLDQSGTALASISLNDGAPSGPLLRLSDPEHHATVVMSVQTGAGSQLALTGEQNALIHMGVTKDGTSLEFLDQNGFSTSVGNGVKVGKSGKMLQTGAASIALMNKDGKVLWSAP